MKEYLQHLAAYNLWANQKFLNELNLLSSDQVQLEITSSFPSIMKTVKHIYDAECAWWSRIQKTELVYKFGEDYPGTFLELTTELSFKSNEWLQYVSKSSEQELNSNIKYIRLNHEYESRIQDILLHLFNHGTYHRGQLTTMMRQIGMTSIPSTDFIAYSRIYI